MILFADRQYFIYPPDSILLNIIKLKALLLLFILEINLLIGF